jgi:nucleotidyltransferase AbiEii toxin of type IV toxin-antitoxin system
MSARFANAGRVYGRRWVVERLDQPLLAALADLAKWLAETRIPAVIIGGVAASVLGRPRLTRDIDALAILPEDAWSQAVDAAARYGIVPRLADALAFARRSRVLLLRHTVSAIDLDVTFGALPFEQSTVERSALHTVGGVLVRLPRVEDLLVMKAVARRPKDLDDIRGLLDAHPEANVAEVRTWVREFATAASMPDMLQGFDDLLAERRT